MSHFFFLLWPRRVNLSNGRFLSYKKSCIKCLWLVGRLGDKRLIISSQSLFISEPNDSLASFIGLTSNGKMSRSTGYFLHSIDCAPGHLNGSVRRTTSLAAAC